MSVGPHALREMGVCRKAKDGTSDLAVHHSDIGLRVAAECPALVQLAIGGPLSFGIRAPLVQLAIVSRLSFGMGV